MAQPLPWFPRGLTSVPEKAKNEVRYRVLPIARQMLNPVTIGTKNTTDISRKIASAGTTFSNTIAGIAAAGEGLKTFMPVKLIEAAMTYGSNSTYEIAAGAVGFIATPGYRYHITIRSQLDLQYDAYSVDAYGLNFVNLSNKFWGLSTNNDRCYFQLSLVRIELDQASLAAWDAGSIIDSYQAKPIAQIETIPIGTPQVLPGDYIKTNSAAPYQYMYAATVPRGGLTGYYPSRTATCTLTGQTDLDPPVEGRIYAYFPVAQEVASGLIVSTLNAFYVASSYISVPLDCYEFGHELDVEIEPTGLVPTEQARVATLSAKSPAALTSPTADTKISALVAPLNRTLPPVLPNPYYSRPRPDSRSGPAPPPTPAHPGIASCRR